VFHSIRINRSTIAAQDSEKMINGFVKGITRCLGWDMVFGLLPPCYQYPAFAHEQLLPFSVGTKTNAVLLQHFVFVNDVASRMLAHARLPTTTTNERKLRQSIKLTLIFRRPRIDGRQFRYHYLGLCKGHDPSGIIVLPRRMCIGTVMLILSRKWETRISFTCLPQLSKANAIKLQR
jgi:hypothetical protein